jgi:hypothetical protein
MAIFSAPVNKSPSWAISVGAEAIAAAQFARCGFDVLVQAGRDKPWYDLVVTKAGNLLKISVKASENGEWALTNGFIRRVAETNGMRIDCVSAIDMWRAGYGSRTVCCLVQFEGVAIQELPRVYLASPDEIAAHMRETAERTGRCTLLEMYEWSTSAGTRSVQMLPDAWSFSHARVKELIATQGNGGCVSAQVRSPQHAVVAPAKPAEQPFIVDTVPELALSAS